MSHNESLSLEPESWFSADQSAEFEPIVLQLARAPDDSQLMKSTRKTYGTSTTQCLCTIASLQAKARKKFAKDPSDDSRVWWVTNKSLQQATPWQVAQFKASWLTGQIYDLCCGIGGDAMALAQQGSVVAVDSDPTIVGMAQANLAACSASNSVLRASASSIDVPSEAEIHIDPDRRAQGQRSSLPDLYSPPWSEVRSITTRVDAALIKLAPAAEIDAQSDGHRCWIALRGSVREQTLLLGSAVKRAGLVHGAKSAVSLSGDGTATTFAPNEHEDTTVELASRPLQYMVDPVASIRAAGLTAAFARDNGLKVLGKLAGFLTCDEPMEHSQGDLATVGAVVWSGSCDDRKLRRELHNRNLYPEVIKCRGTDHDPVRLSKRYRKCGERPITLWIGRTSQRAYAVMTTSTEV